MILKFHKFRLPAIICLINSALGCSSYPKNLLIKDALTDLPVNSVVLAMELRGDYDASDYNPLRRVYRQDRRDRYRKKYKIYGYGRPSKRSFGPGFYYNYAYLNQLPFGPPYAVQVRMDVINSGWKIFTDELPRDNKITYSVTKYYLFKQGYLPMIIPTGNMKMLADSKGNVKIALRPMVAGKFASDWQVIRASKSILAMSQLPHIKTRPIIQRRVLEILADSLAKITALPGDPEPYPDFIGNQAEAEKLLEHIQQGGTTIAPTMDE